MRGPQDGCPDEIFQKWSSRTACSLRRTVSNVRCVEQPTHAETICMTKTWDMVQRANACETANLVNT